MKRKSNAKRKNVALFKESHERLEVLSKNTGITITKLIEMAVQKLISDPPTVVCESEVK
jgi:predicted DNA-binding protein